MSSDTPPLSHSYHYYDPYYYYDWYYHTPNSDALGVVIFIIFIFLIFLAIYWIWGDDEGCSFCMDNNTKSKKRSQRIPVAIKATPVLAPKPRKPPKPSAPPPLRKKKKILVRPYRPVRKNNFRIVTIDSNEYGWTPAQVDLVGRLSQHNFFDMVNREIINKLKQKKNPRELAKQLISLRIELKPDETNVRLLNKYVDLGIEVVRADDINKLDKDLHLLAIDIIARYSGYVNGWNSLPSRILSWVIDFTV